MAINKDILTLSSMGILLKDIQGKKQKYYTKICDV